MMGWRRGRSENCDGHTLSTRNGAVAAIDYFPQMCRVLCVIVVETRQDVRTSAKPKREANDRMNGQANNRKGFVHNSPFTIYVLNLSIHVSCCVVARRVVEHRQ